jgi:preprotein translocase subunit SecE
MAVETKTRNVGPINSLTRYYKDIKSEFKKITWPSREDIFKSTQIVLVVIAIFTLILWAYDSVFGTALRTIISKLK